jgi:hypothetical protein
MKNQNLKSLAASIVALGSAIIFMSLLTPPSYAQGGRNTPSTQSVSKNAEQEMMNREWNLTHVPDTVNQQFRKQEVSLFRQISEDFRRIQIVNNQTMQAVFVNKSFDYKLIGSATDEIRKRAQRLRQNLALPKTPGTDARQNNVGTQNSLDQEQLKVSLVTLDHSVMGFVMNPLFKLPNVLDTRLAETAGRDLDRIIQFSDVIRRNVEKLARAKQTTAPK